ncbi:hypothetical protein P5673_031001 [Acropora cervicornis]|uniref:Uncharacterized protein n=1 Tax=Acropora cervicornis TaxID=6130 RepID=A0AAD9PTD9_ACRCE|nr:hypothetical protein P5673_031001 [Acropora cervicornis]
MAGSDVCLLEVEDTIADVKDSTNSKKCLSDGNRNPLV